MYAFSNKNWNDWSTTRKNVSMKKQCRFILFPLVMWALSALATKFIMLAKKSKSTESDQMF